MSGYVLSVEAEHDLEEIWDWIAQDSIDAADRWIEELFDAFERLAKTPRIGHTREDLTNLPVLFWPVDAYLVIYRIANRQVEIVAITQGSRDVPAFLNRRMG
jgi:plasmid stabilization system protein ParE